MIIYYYLASFLFCVGLVGVLTKRNLISLLLCIELMLSSVNLFFMLFSKTTGNVDSQIQVFFIVTVAAAEAAIGIGIIVSLFKKINTTNSDEVTIQAE